MFVCGGQVNSLFVLDRSDHRMERVIERFTLNRVDRTSYRFETERLPTIQFCNPLLTGFFNQVRRIEIQFADQTFLLTGTTTWPHEIILSQSGREIMATSREKVVGSQYYTWKSDAKTLKIHPRKSDWIVGRHWAFHAWLTESVSRIGNNERHLLILRAFEQQRAIRYKSRRSHLDSCSIGNRAQTGSFSHKEQMRTNNAICTEVAAAGFQNGDFNRRDSVNRGVRLSDF